MNGIQIQSIDVDLTTECRSQPLLEQPLGTAKTIPNLTASSPRSVEIPALRCRVKSFRFPDPAIAETPDTDRQPAQAAGRGSARPRSRTRIRPPADVFSLKDRLFFALQPPIETWLSDRSIRLPFEPFPYQSEGIAFLVPRWSALMGDEMGLGKTMQTIVSMRMLLGSGMVSRILLICPKPLVTNWIHEFRQWASDVPTLVIEGATRKRHALWELPNMPVKIVNYELLARDAPFLEQVDAEFDLVVLDEAQRIKNEHSQTAKAVRSLKRQRSWALTGTPLENCPDDLISIFRFLDAGLIQGTPSPGRLRELTQPYIIRRLKEQVLTQLPPKFVRDAHLDLTASQRQTYEVAEQDGVMRLNDLGDSLRIQNVFELVLRLKQICNFDPATGESAKLDQLKNDMEEIAASGRKALVFSQWVQALKRIKNELSEYNPLEFHGQISSSARQNAIEQFRDDPTSNVLLLSYGAGSVGLNLQFAQYVFLFDRWWNPAVEDQAINRVYRIGQQNPVFITRFLATETIEERIDEVLDRKRALANEIVPGTAPAKASGMSENEVFGLFDIRVPDRASRAA